MGGNGKRFVKMSVFLLIVFLYTIESASAAGPSKRDCQEHIDALTRIGGVLRIDSAMEIPSIPQPEYLQYVSYFDENKEWEANPFKQSVNEVLNTEFQDIQPERLFEVDSRESESLRKLQGNEDVSEVMDKFMLLIRLKHRKIQARKDLEIFLTGQQTTQKDYGDSKIRIEGLNRDIFDHLNKKPDLNEYSRLTNLIEQKKKSLEDLKSSSQKDIEENTRNLRDLKDEIERGIRTNKRIDQLEEEM